MALAIPKKNGAKLATRSMNEKLTICRAVMRPSGSRTGSILIPAFAYSSRYIRAMAKKCGNCHRKRITKSDQAPRVISFEAAVQPIKGGIAPGTAPMAVEADVRVFSGV